MKINEFIQGLRNKSQLNDALEKIRMLEKNIEALELKMDSRTDKPEQQQEPIQPPIVVEKLHIEKISIDKFELSNNFGALGIKELQGKLNIGANYGEGFPFSKKSSSADPSEDRSDPSEAAEQEDRDSNSQESGPRYTINSKDI